jgi:hypothetical protein
LKGIVKREEEREVGFWRRGGSARYEGDFVRDGVDGQQGIYESQERVVSSI